uniref:Titin n=1 Tax=Sander lucioperca TaxID=283035 RepID=A0A8C9ZGA7_SANLU
AILSVSSLEPSVTNTRKNTASLRLRNSVCDKNLVIVNPKIFCPDSLTVEMFPCKYVLSHLPPALFTASAEPRYPPAFDRKLSPQEVTVGDSIELECHMTGSAPIKVTWSKDHKDIRTGGNYKMSCVDNTPHLSILKADKADTGRYFCHASNDMGKDSCSSDITVKEIKNQLVSPAESKKPPVFDVPLKPLTVAEGDKLSLRCHVCGSPPLKIQWMKDRKDLTAAGSTRISFSDGTACLEISAASRHDAGDYLCKATNDAGSEFCKAKVTVQGTKNCEKIQIFLLGGDPIPSVKWMKGKWRQITHGGRISIEQKGRESKLEIREVTKSDSGQYRCVAANKHGEIESSADMHVDEKKEITNETCFLAWNPPRDDGGSKVTNYIVERRAADSEIWHRLSSTVKQTTYKTEVTGRLNAKTKLSIPAVNRRDRGSYTVTATNNMGTAKHTTYVMVLAVPERPEDLHITAVTKDSLSVAWRPPKYDGGTEVTEYVLESRMVGRDIFTRIGGDSKLMDMKFTLTGLKDGSSHEFRVAAINAVGQGKASFATKPVQPITVPSPPVNPRVKDYSKTTADLVWTKPNKDGGSPILGYTVEMKKADTEEWKKVNMDDFIKQCAYRVKGLEEGVTYRFRVNASNMIGDGEFREIPESVTAQDILIPPEIEMDATCREHVTVRVGHNINIIGYIKARPDAEVLWSKEETVLENSKRVTIVQNLPMVHLRIKEATRADHGKYILKASNVGGEASCTITVNVLDRPSHCQNLHTTYATKDSCMINWEAPKDNGGSEITNYIVECREPSISMWSMISSNCTNRKIKSKMMEGHQYLFRVCAVNKVGPGPCVETKTPLLAIDPIEKPGEPENFRATDIGKNYVCLRWRKPDYDGGSPNISYNLECIAKDAEEWVKLNTGVLTDTFFLADKCAENHTYTFR